MLRGTVSKKGQLVVPSEIRRELNIEKGTPVSFLVNGLSIIVTPITPDLADKYMGFLGTDPNVARESIEERHRDDARSTAKLRRVGSK